MHVAPPRRMKSIQGSPLGWPMEKVEAVEVCIELKKSACFRPSIALLFGKGR
jgi:hypothetical protein